MEHMYRTIIEALESDGIAMLSIRQCRLVDDGCVGDEIGYHDSHYKPLYQYQCYKTRFQALPVELLGVFSREVGRASCIYIYKETFTEKFLADEEGRMQEHEEGVRRPQREEQTASTEGDI